jgi:hypothetical protein
LIQIASGPAGFHPHDPDLEEESLLFGDWLCCATWNELAYHLRTPEVDVDDQFKVLHEMQENCH